MERRWLRLAVGLAGWVGAGSAPIRADDVSGRLSIDEATRARCLSILREGFASQEFWPSMHAAEGLSASGLGREVRSALVPRLAAGEADLQHRCGLAREIARAGDLSGVQTLLDVLANPDPIGHAHACESLFKVWQIGDGALLRRVMAQTDQPRLRLMAASALARWGSPKAMETLRAAVKAEDGETARLAAWILGRVGDQSDVAALRAGASRYDDPATHAYFEHALAALGDADGRSALVKNLDHADLSIQVQAAEFVPDARAVDAENALKRLLDAAALDVRIRAADALLRLAGPPPADRAAVVVRDVFGATKEHPRYSEGSVVALRDGRLLYATTEFAASSSDFAKARIVAVESTDEGRSWSRPRLFQENVGQLNVMSVTLRRLSGANPFDGPIGFFYLVKNGYKDLVVDLKTSTDEAATLGGSIRVTAEPGYHVMNNDRVTRLSSGRLVAPVASTADAENGRYASTCYLSDDGGTTWRRSRNTVPYDRRGAMEPEVLELNDGRLLMHLRTQLGHIAVSESTDGGESWSKARSWDVRGPESPATLRRIPSTGDLLLVWNDCYRPGESHGGKRVPLTAAVSTDEGGTWTYRRDLELAEDAGYAYTSILFHRGRALLTYYVDHGKFGSLSSRFRSIPIAWFYEQRR